MDYQTVVQDALHQSELSTPDRFVKISNREEKCDLPKSAWEKLFAKSTTLQTWKGILLSKGVMEIALYPMILYELQPKTIIEIGAFNGGSAVWFADSLETIGIKGDVYGVDIDLSLLDEKAKADSRVQFLQGDCNKLSEVFSPEMLATLPHPWLIIEDAHVNPVAVVDYFHNHGLQTGDYLIVEDTNKYLWEFWGQNWEDDNEVEKGNQKLDDLTNWLRSHEDEYLVDTHYQDMFGYNVSKNWNSILKRF
ncbi:MAG: CmcI family methyltransferase [Waterburya sp.]